MKTLAHTYSIVAREAESGKLGVGVQSHAFACGTLVPWVEACVGAVAIQADVDTSYGRLGLALMRAGKTAEQALAALLAADPESDTRQVAMIDNKGRVATHTGKRCIAHAKHITGEGFSVQGNLLAQPDVCEKMVEAYQQAKGDFNEKMLRALEAAQKAGGDVRGLQSAALIVLPGPDDPLERETITNLRVDDSNQPLVDLRRLLTVQRSYEWQTQASHAVEKGDLESARQHYAQLRGLVVGTREPQFWYATTLAKHGHLDEALVIFAEVFAIEPIWHELLDRLVEAEVFPKDPAVLEKVRALPKRETAKAKP